MALIDDIIEMASNDKEPIGNLLRKCLILERQIPNEKYRAWLDNELDGYGSEDEMPNYRVFNCVNKGLFIGLTVQLNDQPLSLHVMEPKDRKLIEKGYLAQPAASYDGADRTKDSHLPWNPALTTKYQTKFYKDHDLVLNRAWQEIPGSVIVALLEQVRTRVLRFALDIKENLPSDATTASSVPASVVERSVVNNIFHGDVLIASNTNTQTRSPIKTSPLATSPRFLERSNGSALTQRASRRCPTSK
jgi:hypothetical protein